MKQDHQIGVNITAKAASFLKSAMVEARAIGLRLFVKQSGCSGKSYGIDLVTEKNDLDLSFNSNGLAVFITPDSYPMFKGMELDLETDGTNQFLRFNNPNAAHTCGCGKSFKPIEE